MPAMVSRCHNVWAYSLSVQYGSTKLKKKYRKKSMQSYMTILNLEITRELLHGCLHAKFLNWNKLGMLITFPQCNVSLEFPEILSQNLKDYHWLGVSGMLKIMHCGILINMPYWFQQIIFCWKITAPLTCVESVQIHNQNHVYGGICEMWYFIYLLWWNWK